MTSPKIWALSTVVFPNLYFIYFKRIRLAEVVSVCPDIHRLHDLLTTPQWCNAVPLNHAIITKSDNRRHNYKPKVSAPCSRGRVSARSSRSPVSLITWRQWGELTRSHVERKLTIMAVAGDLTFKTEVMLHSHWFRQTTDGRQKIPSGHNRINKPTVRTNWHDGKFFGFLFNHWCFLCVCGSYATSQAGSKTEFLLSN